MAALNDPSCAELMAQALELQVKSLNDQIALLRGYTPPASDVVAVEEDAGPKKKKKKVVDPNRPKRSHSAYQMFIMEILPKLKGEYPDLTQRDIMSLGAKAWSTIPAQKKQDLEALAAKEKAQYDIVLKSYEADKALGNSAAPSTSPSSVPAPETAAPPIVKAKRAKKAPVPVPETAPVEPVVAAPTPAPTPTPGQEEKKRKKEKKSKKEPPTPSEESAKKKKKSSK